MPEWHTCRAFFRHISQKFLSAAPLQPAGSPPARGGPLNFQLSCLFLLLLLFLVRPGLPDIRQTIPARGGIPTLPKLPTFPKFPKLPKFRKFRTSARNARERKTRHRQAVSVDGGDVLDRLAVEPRDGVEEAVVLAQRERTIAAADVAGLDRKATVTAEQQRNYANITAARRQHRSQPVSRGAVSPSSTRSENPRHIFLTGSAPSPHARGRRRSRRG